MEPRRDASLLPVIVEDKDPKPFWRPGQRKFDGRRTPQVQVSYQKRAEWFNAIFGFNDRWPGRRVETRLPIPGVDCRMVTYPNPNIQDIWFTAGGYDLDHLRRMEQLISLVLKNLDPMNKGLLQSRRVKVRAHIAPHRVPWSRLPLGISASEVDHYGKPMADPSVIFAFGISKPMHPYMGEFALPPTFDQNGLLEELLHTIHATAFSRKQHLFIENLFDQRHKSGGPWQNQYRSSELGEFFVGIAIDYLRFTRAAEHLLAHQPAKAANDGLTLVKELFPKWRQLERPVSVRNWPPRFSYPALPPILLPSSMTRDQGQEVL